MTNRQWLIWQLIDMPDEKFALKYCSSIRCSDCPEEPINECCHGKLIEWMKQEHEDGGKNEND